MNKQSIITILFTVLMSITGAKAFAHDFSAANNDGVTIYYVWINNYTEFAVSYCGSYYDSFSNEYSGNVVIPKSVDYNGNTYPVTSIRSEAFRGCSGLTSVTIPISVTSIGYLAFYNCSGLTSVTISDGVTSIGQDAFNGTAWYNNQPDGLVYAGKVAYKYKGTMPNNTEIEIKDGTLCISSYAFNGCNGLASITIPNSVTSIGSYAFYGCSALASIAIPNGLTTIGSYAFYGCSALGSITIPNYVTSINEYTFYNCSGLTSITIPNSVTTIGQYAFYNCNSLTSFAIPNSITSIGQYAFQYCSGLSSIEFHCQTIGSWFSNSTSINEITIGDEVTSIGASAFYGCSGLTSITIPNSVTSIGEAAFQNCSGINTIVSEIKNPFVIETSVFFDWNEIIYSTATLIVPENTKASYQSSTGWSRFKNIAELGEGGVIGNKIEVDDVFYIIGENNTAAITSSNKKYSGAFEIQNQVTYNGKIYSVTSIGESAFNGCSNLTSITIPNNVISIGSSAFSSCSGLTNITIPNSVTSIEKSTFYGCSGLTSVTIPSSLTSIGESAFSGCNGLTSINIPNNVTSIGQNAFYGCSSLSSLIIPNSVTSIGEYAFWYCSSLTSVIIGSGVTSIGSSAFSGTNLKKTIWLTNTPPSGYSNAAGAVNYVSNNQFSFNDKLTYQYQFLSSYFDINGIRYVPISPSERTCDAIDCVYDESAASTKIASTVEYRGVTMTVKNIKPYLAYNNKFIKTLTVDNDGELADYAFTDCSNLETAIIGEKINRIGKGTFSGCSSLTSLTTSEKTTLSNVLCISKNVTTIDNYAFKGCSAIKNIIFMDSDAELKLGANGIVDRYYDYSGTPLFSDCPLDSVYIGRNIDYNTTKQYGYSPFYSNTSLRAVKITDLETEISDNEFYGCTNLQRVVIGDGVTTIGNWAFSGCQSLKFFAFGSQVTTIGQEAFSDCAAVIEISSKAKTAPECGDQALDDINKWDCKLYVPDGCMAAYENANQWKDFFFKEEGEGTAGQGAGAHSDNNQKCETPTITIDGGTIKFDCKTSGVMYHYNISSADAKSDVANSSIEVKNSYTITVYASKEGYIDSEVVRASFQVAGAGKKGDVDGNGVVNVADHVELSKIILEQGQ